MLAALNLGLGFIASVIGIFVFVTGKSSLEQTLNPGVAETKQSAEAKPKTPETNPTTPPKVSPPKKDTPETNATPQDQAVVTALKGVAACFILIFGLVVLFFVVCVHVLLALFGGSIEPAIFDTWGFIWNDVVVDWWWQPASIWGIVLTVVIFICWAFVQEQIERIAKKRLAQKSAAI